MNDPQPLPTAAFTTAQFGRRDQFEAWRESISVIFDVAPHEPDAARDGFKASVRAHHLGDLVLSQVDFERQRFSRERRRAAMDGLDHYLVQLYATGGLSGVADGHERILRAGDVQILDLSRANTTHALASQTVALVVPRDALREALPVARDLHGLVLRGSDSAGGLLADHLRSLATRADTLTAVEAPKIARATTAMIAACFHTTAETQARARTVVEEATLKRLQRHVAANLRSRELRADTLFAAFQISRSQLYRLFEPLGGVAAYIQEQRLARAYGELADPTHAHRRIYDIAYDWGFASEAHFSRLFKQAFGLSPSEVRERAKSSGFHRAVSGEAPTADGYQAWIRDLRPR